MDWRRGFYWGLMAALSILTTACTHPGPDVDPPPKGKVVADAPGAGAPMAPSNAQFMTTSELAEKADVPLFPGALVPEGASNVRADNGSTRYEIVMSTTKMPESVLKYYEGKLKHAERIAGNSTLMGMTPQGHYASIKTARLGDTTDISVVVTVEASG